MKAAKIGLICFYAVTLIVCGCEVEPKKPEARETLASDVNDAITLMKDRDPSIKKFFDKSYGYAILPKVFKIAFIAGGGYGKGEVYAQGERVGYCDMTQGTLGASIGGEFYREVIFFEKEKDLEKFKYDFAFSAQMSAVGIVWGKAGQTNYHDGMVVFVMTDAGLMGDVSVGGQKFGYEPTYVLRKVEYSD